MPVVCSKLRMASLIPALLLLSCVLLHVADAASSRLNKTDETPAASMQISAAIDTSSSSTICNITGECKACTAEQQEQDPSCQTTGYVQEISCVEYFGEAGGSKKAEESLDEKDKEEEADETVAEREERKSEGKEEKAASDEGQGRRLFEEKRKPLASAEGALRRLLSGMRVLKGTEQVKSEAQKTSGKKTRRFTTFESCKPEVESLSVIGFESIMLGILAICGPVVYHRKKRGALSVGGSRNPSGMRF